MSPLCSSSAQIGCALWGLEEVCHEYKHRKNCRSSPSNRKVSAGKAEMSVRWFRSQVNEIMKVTRYIRHTWRTKKVLKFLFVLKIVTEFRFWKFRAYFWTIRFEIFSIPKLRVRRCRASQAVGIFRHSWSNDVSGNSGFYIHGFVYSGLSLVVCPTQLTFFDDFVVTTTKVRSVK